MNSLQEHPAPEAARLVRIVGRSYFPRVQQRHPAGEKSPGGSRACIMLNPASRPRAEELRYVYLSTHSL